MIFLIEYNRRQGKLITFKTYNDVEQREADDDRLKLELRLLDEGVENEVVILKAFSEAALRRTHRRYFEDLSQLARLP